MAPLRGISATKEGQKGRGRSPECDARRALVWSEREGVLAPWALPWQRDGARWKGAGAAERGRAGTRAEERTEVKRSASQGQCAAATPLPPLSPARVSEPKEASGAAVS